MARTHPPGVGSRPRRAPCDAAAAGCLSPGSRHSAQRRRHRSVLHSAVAAVVAMLASTALLAAGPLVGALRSMSSSSPSSWTAPPPMLLVLPVTAPRSESPPPYSPMTGGGAGSRRNSIHVERPPTPRPVSPPPAYPHAQRPTTPPRHQRRPIAVGAGLQNPGRVHRAASRAMDRVVPSRRRAARARAEGAVLAGKVGRTLTSVEQQKCEAYYRNCMTRAQHEVYEHLTLEQMLEKCETQRQSCLSGAAEAASYHGELNHGMVAQINRNMRAHVQRQDHREYDRSSDHRDNVMYNSNSRPPFPG
ncbi:hypothetical protein HK405_014102 [Cladochytrium tenue]|nr:hypothetical protein HK405_014102 [Cladochytrium tenue]